MADFKSRAPRAAPDRACQRARANARLCVRRYRTPSDKIVLVLVGLPARGKTFVARKIHRYLEFFHVSSAARAPVAATPRSRVRFVAPPRRASARDGRDRSGRSRSQAINVKVFNIGNYRRSLHGPHQSAEWFAPDNAEGATRRGRRTFEMRRGSGVEIASVRARRVARASSQNLSLKFRRNSGPGGSFGDVPGRSRRLSSPRTIHV